MTLLGWIGDLAEISRIGAEEISFEWQIPNFLSLSAESEDYYFSPDVRFGDELWSLSMWPKWTDETENPASEWLRLDLIRCYEGCVGPPKTFHISVSIKGLRVVEKGREVEREFLGYGHHDWVDFCSRRQLMEYKSRLMPENILTIMCVLKSVVPGAAREVHTQTYSPYEVWTEVKQSSEKRGQQSDDCVICYEKPVDSVLYRCGHMCICYDCAVKLRKSNSAQCPVCRESIQDVIKVYR